MPLAKRMTPADFDRHVDFARACDAADELAALAREFEIPTGPEGRAIHYLCGHSLGLMPRGVRARVARELDRWSRLGVGGHFDADGDWYSIHERFAEPLADLLGAEPREVVAMNALTVNLHLMLVSFFTPDAERRRIVIERGAFPSDRYAVQSQLGWHGLDPERDLIELAGPGNRVTAEALEATLAAARGTVALVLLPGVQYLTGEAVSLAECAEVARRHGCRVGFDLAHAIGNLPLALRASEPDFAVWCSYKYLNGGPGAIGGCFVNRRWIDHDGLPRFEGWWGHEQTTRFTAQARFEPIVSADAWQLSNPPVLAMVPLAPALERCGAAARPRLREKSVALTAYLEWLLEQECADRIELLTPRDSDARGAQLSLRLRLEPSKAEDIVGQLAHAGVCVDWRPPDVLRLAPVPLYNSFADVHACALALGSAIAD
jgi:kynureninase